MVRGLELIIPNLEILEIEVSTFPRILELLGNLVFLISPILDILEVRFFDFSYPGHAGGGPERRAFTNAVQGPLN